MSEIDYVITILPVENGFEVELQLRCDSWDKEYVRNCFNEDDIESTIQEALNPSLGTMIGPHTKYVIEGTIRSILDEWILTI